MGGRKARDVSGVDFCGGLDIEYTVGPSADKALANLVVDNQEEIRLIFNVIGRIPGLLPRDQDMSVLLGIIVMHAQRDSNISMVHLFFYF
jgi:hypothetical protein